MRSEGLIIAPDIVSDGILSLKDILIAALWDPFCLKASKEAFSGSVVPTVTFSAHTLCHTPSLVLSLLRDWRVSLRR